MMLDLEWERCRVLMSKVSPSYAELIEQGFIERLLYLPLNDTIRSYLSAKFSVFDELP
jgi:hypothetical protein